MSSRRIQFTVCFFISILTTGAAAQQLSDTLLIEEAVVTAGRIEIARSITPISITVISNDFINEQEETNILPIIAKKTPSLFVSEIGVAGYALGNSTSGQLTIRGLGGAPNSRVMMMVDGQPQFMGIFGHPLPNFHMTSNVERVEVIRGPASLIYGSNAMGGVINIITKKNEDKGFSGDAYFSYGSFNTLKYGMAAGYNKNGFSAGIRVNKAQTAGHRDSSEFENTNIHAYGSYVFNNHWTLRTGMTVADYSFMDPGSEFQVNPITFMGDIRRNMFTFSLEDNYAQIKGGLFFFYNSGTHDFSDGWYSQDRNIGVNLYQSLDLWKGANITGGIDIKSYGAGGAISNILPPTFQLVTYMDTTLMVSEKAAYLIAGQSLGNYLNFTIGSRYEIHSIYGGEIVPQIGITARPFRKTTIKGLFSKGFRSPALMELYLFPTANPDLLSEKLFNYELSFTQYISDRANISGSAYLMKGSNLIMTRLNPNPPPPVRRYNEGEITNWGIEIEADYNPVGNIGIDMSYSYLNANQDILFAPKHKFFLGGNYRLGNLSIALNLIFVGELYTFIDSEAAVNNILESYSLLDAKLTYYFDDKITLFIAGKNLLNQEYQTVYGYEMPKIHFMSGVSVKLK